MTTFFGCGALRLPATIGDAVDIRANEFGGQSTGRGQSGRHRNKRFGYIKPHATFCAHLFHGQELPPIVATGLKDVLSSDPDAIQFALQRRVEQQLAGGEQCADNALLGRLMQRHYLIPGGSILLQVGFCVQKVKSSIQVAHRKGQENLSLARC